MAIERDDSAERIARIDKLMAEMKPGPQQQRARRQTPQQIVTSSEDRQPSYTPSTPS
jgi:hypothetical protein